jgi:hypothetical protein
MRLIRFAMDLTKISASEFGRIQALLQRKGKLQDEIRSIDSELASIQSGTPAASKPGRKPGRAPGRPKKSAPKAPAPKAKSKPGKRGKRGAVKDSIIKILKAAGPEGLTAREVADELKAKPINIATWFSSTGKLISQIKAGANGKRVWVEGTAPAEAPAAPAETAEAPASTN